MFLLAGMDEVGETLLFADRIRAFEQARITHRPWL